MVAAVLPCTTLVLCAVVLPCAGPAAEMALTPAWAPPVSGALPLVGNPPPAIREKVTEVKRSDGSRPEGIAFMVSKRLRQV
jgi:hypothetical protein